MDVNTLRLILPLLLVAGVVAVMSYALSLFGVVVVVILNNFCFSFSVCWWKEASAAGLLLGVIPQLYTCESRASLIGYCAVHDKHQTTQNRLGEFSCPSDDRREATCFFFFFHFILLLLLLLLCFFSRNDDNDFVVVAPSLLPAGWCTLCFFLLFCCFFTVFLVSITSFC